MAEIIILIGNGRSGKTTYAHKLEEQGYEYISLDDHYHYKGEEEFLAFINLLADKLNNSDKNFVLDGYCYFEKDRNFDYLIPKLKNHKIKPTMIFTNCELIRKRSEEKIGEIRAKEQIIEDYERFRKFWNIEGFEFIEGIGENRKLDSYEEGMKVVKGTTKKDVEDFLVKLKGRNHDPFYQTIELPFGMMIQGYNADFEHKSWNEISKIYDFKNKKVADIGMHNGYFCFEVKNHGAFEVVGYDKNPQAVETAKEIACLKEFEITFKTLDIEEKDIPDFDVILFLNASHHLTNPVAVFDRIFSRAKDVILEVQLTQRLPEWSIVNKEKLVEIAEKYNHKLIKEVKSPRPDRMIFLFSK